MSAPERRRAKRLLVLPGLLLAGIIAAVVTVPTLTEREPHVPEPLGGLLPLIASDEEECRRDTETGDAPEEREPIVAGEGRVSSAMILACPVRFDGLRVSYTGELVGDLLHRDGGAWVMVNDDDYAITYGPLPTHREYQGTNSGLSVWLPDDLLDEVTGLGRPDQRGDVVQLEGAVLRTDPDDGGGLTLRADRIEVLRPAEGLAEPFDRPRAALAAVSVLSGAALWALRRRAQR